MERFLQALPDSAVVNRCDLYIVEDFSTLRAVEMKARVEYTAENK